MKTINGKIHISHILNKIPAKENMKPITIKDGDRVIYLKPVSRNIGEGTHMFYDVYFFNNSEGVKIKYMSFGYCISHKRFQYGETILNIGLDLWVKNDSLMDETLNTYTEEHLDVFYSYVENKIFSHFGIA